MLSVYAAPEKVHSVMLDDALDRVAEKKEYRVSDNYHNRHRSSSRDKSKSHKNIVDSRKGAYYYEPNGYNNVGKSRDDSLDNDDNRSHANYSRAVLLGSDRYKSRFRKFLDKPLDFFQVKAGGYKSNSINKNNQLSTKSDDSPSFVLGAGFGKKFTDNVSADIDYNYRNPVTLKMYDVASQNTTFQEWSVESHTVTVNGKYSFPFASWSPYIRGGVGISLNKSGNYIDAAHDKSSVSTFPGKALYSFTWQIGGGMQVDHSQRISSIIEYMFMNRGKFSTQDIEIVEANGQSAVQSVLPKTNILKDHMIMYGVGVKF